MAPLLLPLLLLASAAHAADVTLKVPAGRRNRTLADTVTRPQMPSIGDVLLVANLSQIAYCPIDAIPQWRCVACRAVAQLSGFNLITTLYNEEAQVQGFIAAFWFSNTPILTLSFRGTETLKNWIADIDFAKVYPGSRLFLKNPPADVRVHEGFYNSWMALRASVVSEVNPFLEQYPNAQVWLTGHSLGAAMAAMAAIEFGDAGLDTFVVNFGQPRLGNDAFVSYVKQLGVVTYRVTHGNDPVPHLPDTIQGFAHVPWEIFYDTDALYTTARMCDGSGKDPTCMYQYTPLSYSHSTCPSNTHCHYMGMLVPDPVGC